MTKIKTAVIGCGNISDIYLKNLKRFENIELVCCGDLDEQKAAGQAEKYSIKHCSIDQIMANKDISIILNITPPAAHYPVAKAALENGHHVYNEKPLSSTVEQARELVDIAAANKLLLGGAPDTFMGAGIQTCRKLIDEGAIGRPLSFTAFMMSRGVEKWHPNPEFFYKVGGGPLLDMGPYYLTALVNLVGGFEYVQSVAVKGFQQRLVKSQPKFGTVIDVETPTHINGLLVCKSGVVGTLTTSFDVHKHSMPWIEIYGSDGTLSVPDPNTFGGKVRLFREDAEDWETVPLIDGYPENSRGLGIHDMANAVITGGSFRADSSLTFHVLETMHAMLKAGECGCKVGLKSFCERPRAWREKPGALWIETNE